MRFLVGSHDDGGDVQRNNFCFFDLNVPQKVDNPSLIDLLTG